MTLQREIEWEPAWDKRHPDPKENFGLHGVNMRWLLKGSRGVIQFLVYTNWYLPHVREELEQKGADYRLFQPYPADLGYHSPFPMHEDDKPISESCRYLDGRPCYYDGSGLKADKLFDLLVTEGGEAVWKRMEEEYRSVFGEEER